MPARPVLESVQWVGAKGVPPADDIQSRNKLAEAIAEKHATMLGPQDK